jgi:hypothetical protein
MCQSFIEIGAAHDCLGIDPAASFDVPAPRKSPQERTADALERLAAVAEKWFEAVSSPEVILK